MNLELNLHKIETKNVLLVSSALQETMNETTLAENYLLSKYDEIANEDNGAVDFYIQKTKFTITKTNTDIELIYTSSHNIEFTYSCSNRSDLENYAKQLFC